MTGKKRGGGPKGKYHKWLEPEGLILLAGWSRDGLTIEQIANKMQINRATLHEWLNKYQELADILKDGKEVVDNKVEDSLFKRAMGYRTMETKTEYLAGGGVRVTKTEKEILPDVTAQIFWLKNRKRAEWRDRQDHEHTGKDGGGIKIELAGDIKEWAK